MTVGLSDTFVYTDIQGLGKLRKDAQNDDPATRKVVAEQFEALFLQLMLKEMRGSSLAEGIFDNDQTRFYQEFFDKQVALTMAQNKGVGLAEVLARQFSQGENMIGGVNGLRAQHGDQGSSVSLEKRQEAHRFRSQREFVETLRPLAQQTAKRLGVSTEVLLAQAALETGWGGHVMHHSHGASSHNLFGIKADERWDGEWVVKQTIEFEAGVAVKRKQAFRSYPSYADSFRDYAAFIAGDQRYQQALGKGPDSLSYARELQRAGYATDPHYALKIKDIMERLQGQVGLAGLQKPADAPLI